jgi:copper chaperone NosL
MSSFLSRSYEVLGLPIRGWARVAVILLVIPMALSFTLPLWRIRMEAPQYPSGLYMDIYAYKLDAGHGGHDITEINELNHYIGMQKIDESQIPDLDWIPFAFGALVLLTLRAGVVGEVRSLVDICTLSVYVSIFSMVRFGYKLYSFGHFLDPKAAVHVPPFMPVLLGTKQIANFTTHGYPMGGSYLVGLFMLGLLFVTIWHFYRYLRSVGDPGAGLRR